MKDGVPLLLAGAILQPLGFAATAMFGFRSGHAWHKDVRQPLPFKFRTIYCCGGLC
jgi:hypothetical protein